MNIKNLSLLMVCAFAVPVYATEEVSVANPTEEQRDYAKEDAANSKLALAEMGVLFGGGAIGSLVGIITKSALCGGIVGTLGCTISVVAYYNLRDKYKEMFNEAAYADICRTENKVFDYSMTVLTAPVIILLTHAVGLTAGYVLGGVIGKAGVFLGVNAELAKYMSVVASAIIPFCVEAKPSSIKEENYGGPDLIQKVQHYSKYLAYASIAIGSLAGACAQYK